MSSLLLWQFGDIDVVVVVVVFVVVVTVVSVVVVTCVVYVVVCGITTVRVHVAAFTVVAIIGTNVGIAFAFVVVGGDVVARYVVMVLRLL